MLRTPQLGPGIATWRELLDDARHRLSQAGVDNAGQEALWMVEQAAGLRTAALQLALNEAAPAGHAASLEEMLDRRLQGEPLQYILGRWGFRHVELHVDRRVLIPRPETESLVEAAHAECDRLGARVVADLGTGSGAIAASLACERAGTEIWATDLSANALAVARRNVTALGKAAERVRFGRGWWFHALPSDLRGRVDVVVSNPPYIAEMEMVDLPEEVRRWEPELALLAGPSGLDHIAAILAEAPAWLARPGALLLEISPSVAGEARRLARRAGFVAVSVWPDLAGRDRILQARV
jgi:release factor glutamine methyltransferase